MSTEKITWTRQNDDGEEYETKIPAKYEVCSRCEGHGTHLTPSIGEHAYSQEEFEESFCDEEDREQYFRRGGIYDVRCEECSGKRVVLVPDWDHCPSDLRAEYEAHLDEEADYEAMCAAERRMGA